MCLRFLQDPFILLLGMGWVRCHLWPPHFNLRVQLLRSKFWLKALLLLQFTAFEAFGVCVWLSLRLSHVALCLLIVLFGSLRNFSSVLSVAGLLPTNFDSWLGVIGVCCHGRRPCSLPCFVILLVILQLNEQLCHPHA